MLKQKITGTVQEVILPDFPDDDNTVTTTVTKSRRVSFGPNFVKEFIVDSAITGQCMPEYEQSFPSSDSSSAESSHSAVGQSTFVVHENIKVHKSESGEERPKPPKFGSTICFSADSPTADMEFTEGCITLAKSILDKKNKEMTVFIQAKSKEGEKAKEDDTNYFEGSQFEMSVTKCLKSKENSRQQEKRFVGEKTRVFSKYDDEMSMTMCEKLFVDQESDDNWEEGKENRMPLDAIMRHLDKDSSDSDLFNPEKSFGQLFGANPFEISDESEDLNLNESMDISGEAAGGNLSEKSTNEMNNFQPSFDKSDALLSDELKVKGNIFETAVNPPSFMQEIVKDMTSDEAMDISMDIQSGKAASFREAIHSEKMVDGVEIRTEKMELSMGIRSGITTDLSEDIQSEKTVDIGVEIQAQEEMDISMDIQSGKMTDLSKDIDSEKTIDIGVEIRKEKKMELNMDIQPGNTAGFSEEFQSEKTIDVGVEIRSEKEISMDIQSRKTADLNKDIQSEKTADAGTETRNEKKAELSVDIRPGNTVDLSKDIRSKKMVDIGVEIQAQEEMDISMDIQSGKMTDFNKDIQSERTEDVGVEIRNEKNAELSVDIQPRNTADLSEDIQSKKTIDAGVEIRPEKEVSIDIQSRKMADFSQDILSEKTIDAEVETRPGKEVSVDNQSRKMASFSEDIQSEKTADAGIEIRTEKEMDITVDIQSGKTVDFSEDIHSEKTIDIEVGIQAQKEMNIEMDIQSGKTADFSKDIHTEKTVDIGMEIRTLKKTDNRARTQSNKAVTAEVTSNDVMDGSTAPSQSITSENFPDERNKAVQRSQRIGVNESEQSEAQYEKSTLADVKVVESLTEQSKEPGCMWSLKELRHPGRRTGGLLSFSCRLLESTTSLDFILKTSEKDGLDSFSIVTDSRIQLDEEKQWRLPEYTIAVKFGFSQLKEHFEERRQHVETIRHVPYFLDEVNSFLSKTNTYLQQVHSVLTSYPGSRLRGSVLSFRLFSFPIFFSCTVSINLENMFRLSRASLSFEHDFGCLDEKKVREIFEECLKRENSLCEFVVQSTRYLVELERPSGHVSKRGHIRLLPEELRS